MYALIKGGYVSMMELCEYYTLDEALKLYALVMMENDIQEQRAEESRKAIG